MQRYLTADLHLGHANIIEYCNRPFDDVEEMTQALITNWNDTVDEDDIVFFLGDLGSFADESQLRHWLEKLHGRIVFIEGNHDHPDRYTTGLNTHQYYILESGQREFCLTHSPSGSPQWWDGWTIHGHHHNNDLEMYPLVHPDAQRVNLSVELTGYAPLSERVLHDLLDSNATIRTIADSQ